jgi:sortase A
MRSRILQSLQSLLLVTGSILLGTSALTLLDRSASSHAALMAFDRAQADTVDFTLWSPKRVREYQASLSTEKQLPLAVLEIAKLRLRVPLFEGTDDLVLNRGVGWIVGTARPGEAGNIGVAGHRDGFFRALKDIAAGDAIDLETLGLRATYIVDQIEIVSPEHVEVLQPRAAPSITLVTCYPFYFVGDAPQRFIVHASRVRTVPTSARPSRVH